MITDEMKSHFMNLYNMVLADGTVKPEELLQVYRIGQRHGISEEEFNRLLISPASFIAPETLEQKVTFLYDMVEIILADQDIDHDEVATLKRYCIRFGFEPENVDAISSFLIESVKSGKPLDSVIQEITE